MRAFHNSHVVIQDTHFNQVEAAHYLGRSPRWLQYQLGGPNPPPGYKIGKAWIFKKSELDHWLEQFRASNDLDRVVNEVMNDLQAGR
jgi:hypothetical protein